MSKASRFTSVALVGISIALGIYGFSLRSQLAEARRELNAAILQREDARQAERRAVAETAPLQQNVARLTAERDALRAGSSGSAATPAAASATKTNESLGGIAQTFATPEMRQMVRREALSDARKGFADLLKQWNLTPAEADQFLEFVADRDSADAADALSMLASGKLDEKAVAEQKERQEKAEQASNARLKSLLGEQRFAEFEAVHARQEELKAIASYRDHLESAGTPLSDEQRVALAKIAKKEKPDENDWAQEDIEFFTKGMTDAQLAKIRQRQEAAQARIAQQATSFLSPDQINHLQAAFRTEIEEQELALKMARNLFQSGGAPMPPR
jgi:hypothetical protein